MEAAHLLALLLIILIVGNQFLIFRLKRAKEVDARLHTYWLIMASLWLATAAAAGIMGSRTLWYVHVNPWEERWLPGNFVTMAIAIVSIAAMLAPLAMVRKPAGLAALLRQIEKLSFILPQSARERLWWALVSITAGICEEYLFRGFLLYYLHISPWKARLGFAIPLACLVFGLGHLYQGVKGAFGSAAVGFLLFLLFLGTGNLLWPMVLHALADLRVLLVLKAVRARTVSAPGSNS